MDGWAFLKKVQCSKESFFCIGTLVLQIHNRGDCSREKVVFTSVCGGFLPIKTQKARKPGGSSSSSKAALWPTLLQNICFAEEWLDSHNFIKVLDWVAKQLSWANLSLLLALVPWERHMVSVCLMGSSCKTLKWIVKKIQYFQIRLFRPMQDGWWLVRLWAGRQRCAGSSKRLLFTGLPSFSPTFTFTLVTGSTPVVTTRWLPQQIWVAITRLSIQPSYRRRLARALLVSTFYIDGGSKKRGR